MAKTLLGVLGTGATQNRADLQQKRNPGAHFFLQMPGNFEGTFRLVELTFFSQKLLVEFGDPVFQILTSFCNLEAVFVTKFMFQIDNV